MNTETSFVRRRQVLFVDDDVDFLGTIGKLYEAYSHGSWEIHLAPSTARALAILDGHPLDLVVIDVQMPVVDGIQFLQLVHRRFPGLGKVVLTGFGNEEMRAKSLEQGADLYLEKPRTSEGFESVFATMQELANWQPQEGFRGLLRQVGLSDVLQMECLAKNSSILELTSDQFQGHIYIKEGTIIHAQAGQASGEPAFHRLFALPGGSFSLKPFEEPPVRSIDAHWEFLLMEAARKRDEEAGDTMILSRPAQGPCEPADGAEVAEPQPEPDPPVIAMEPRRIDEVLVCSGRNEVLYAWQCQDIESRLKLIRSVEQKAELMAQRLPLGLVDRVEIEGPDGRVVAQIQPDRKLWVRSNPIHAPETS